MKNYLDTNDPSKSRAKSKYHFNNKERSPIGKSSLDDKMKASSPNDALKKSLEGAIVTEKPNVKWDDVAGLIQAKEALQ